ncbi:MAG: hypothetical protein Kow0065_24730 [Methylomicrobium sp.]
MSLRFHGLTRFSDYCRLLENDSGTEFTQFINAITTNLTSFFRENHHFEYLKNRVIPELLEVKKSKRIIKAWSAGCSTGEEPYSLAMTLLENIPDDWQVKILATDLDTQVLATAASGIYSFERVNGIAEQRLKRWFKKGKGKQSGKVKIKPELRNVITFKQLNLMQDWSFKTRFDVIFCRNVFIYFDKDTKMRLVSKYADVLEFPSHLFIGHSETLQHLTDRFESLGNTIYRKIR